MLFSNRAVSAKRSEIDEDLLKLFRRVEINISLFDTIKQIPKYTKFLKELCIHRRKKMKGTVETRGVVSVQIWAYSQFHAPLTVVHSPMPCWTLASMCKLLNLGDFEPIGMEIQLANRSVVQPLNVCNDVLVQVNELIFPTDFYVLDMEDEASEEGSTLILGRPFFMIVKMKINVHSRTLSMEFEDTYVFFFLSSEFTQRNK
ncbi:hypothetical protein CR513_15311, partial [Mucuna pruriens]